MREIRTKSPMLPQIEDELLEQAVRGEVAIYWHDQLLPLKLNRAEQSEFKQAKERGFVIIKTRRVNLEWVWGFWSENHGIPNLYLRKTAASVAVRMDLISFGTIEEAGDRRIRETLRDELAPRVRDFLAGNYTKAKIKLETSERVAEQLLAIANLYCRRNKRSKE